jgi:hypothetical protein
VDGGLTDNDPFQLAHDYLAIHNPKHTVSQVTGALQNPSDPAEANCAVLTVAPFPSPDAYQSDFDFDQCSSIAGMLARLANALLSQSRFLGESLTAVLSGSSVSRFVLAPSGPDTDPPQKSALQCSLLGAFGGFFERGFRAHDYQLGRRNCQKFLTDHFRLAENNPIIQAGMNKLTPDARAMVQGRYLWDKDGQKTIPIIPLCGTVVQEVPLPDPATITTAQVNQILGLIIARMHALVIPMLTPILGSGPEAMALRGTLGILISTVGKDKLSKYLQKELAEVLAGHAPMEQGDPVGVDGAQA